MDLILSSHGSVELILSSNESVDPILLIFGSAELILSSQGSVEFEFRRTHVDFWAIMGQCEGAVVDICAYFVLCIW